MASKTIVVGSAVGLHARPATLVAQAAGRYDDEISIRLSDMTAEEAVDAGSSLLIMSLGAEHGDEVILESDNEEALADLAALIESDLDA